jgi:hypothetical protein
MSPDSTSFWARTWQGFRAALAWLGQKVVGPLLAVLVVIGAILLLAMGAKGLQIGGLLGKLLGRKDEPEKKTVEIANTIPPGRVDKDGKLIPQGTPDSQGMVQAVVVPVDQPGLFSKPGTVTFTPPGETKPVEVVLPDGVKNQDVAQVVVVSPSVVVVTVKDSSGVPAAQVDDLLKKYGG